MSRGKTFALGALAVIIVLCVCGVLFHKHQVKSEQKAQLLKLMNEDTAAIQTLMAGLQGNNITYGQSESLCDKDQEERTKRAVAARSLDVPYIEGSKQSFVNLLDKEGDLVRGMYYLNLKQVAFMQVSEEKTTSFSGNYYALEYELREQRDHIDKEQKALKDLIGADNSLRQALYSVGGAETSMASAAKHDGVSYVANSPAYRAYVEQEIK